jgi:hypothetical protein
MRLMSLTTKIAASALSLAFGAGALLLPAPAAAEENIPIDTKIMRSIMEGLGLKRDGEAGINYQERAPLVIPPSRDLPPPEKTDAALARNPAWPVDPDVKRAKAEALAEKNQMNADEMLLHDGRPLTEDQMTPGPKPRSTRPTQSGSYETSPYGYSNQSKPSELGYKGNIFSKMFKKDDEESAKFTGEPPRASLTEPPRGYQTPSPDQPYGVGKAKPVTPTSADYLLNHPVGAN